MLVGQTFNPYRVFVGAFIPNCIMRLPVKILGSTEKLIYARLSQYAGQNGRCFPKQETLAEEVGLSIPVIQVGLRKLESEGFIRRVAATGHERLMHKPNEYEFLWHEVFEEEMAADPLNSMGRLEPLNSMARNKDIKIREKNTVDSVKQPNIQIFQNHNPSYTNQTSSSRTKMPPPPPDPLSVDKGLAQQLANIIQSKKNIKHQPSQITAWAKSLHTFRQKQKMNPARIRKCLDWYAEHIGEMYVPVIESADSLIRKFINLENAVERSKQETFQQNRNPAHCQEEEEYTGNGLMSSIERRGEIYLPDDEYNQLPPGEYL